MFYNEKMKNEYLKTIKNKNHQYIRNCENIFKRSEPVESKLEKDASSFTKDEAKELFKSMDSVSPDYLIHAAYLLDRYTKFCDSKSRYRSMDTIYETFTYDDMNTLYNAEKAKNGILTRDEMLQFCDKAKNPKDRLILLGIFEGIRGKELSEFCDIDIHEVRENKVFLKQRGYWIDISPELSQFMQDQLRATDYYMYQKTPGSQMRYNSIAFIENGTLMKSNVRDKYARPRAVYMLATNLIERLNMGEHVTIKSIRDSGIIDFIQTEAKQKEISPREYLYKYTEEIKRQYGLNSFALAPFFERYSQWL